jgi:phage terminase large subunit
LTELTIAFQPKQRLFRDSMEKFAVTGYGGAKGGGKSHAIRNNFLLRRFEYAGSHGGIFRKTYPELEANHIRPLLNQHPFLRQYWNDSKKLLTLPNGSTLQFCYAANEGDIDNYQGVEFHDLGIDQAELWTETMFRKLHGSNRSSRAGIKARCALTMNPGNIGHGWLKRIFVERRFNERERPEDYNFIQALVGDNAALMENDPDYVHRLNAEPNEALRRAYLFGDWDIMAGQFFSDIKRSVHLIEPFDIPPHWLRFGSYDYGFNHPASFGWYACDEDGNVYQYREYERAKRRIDEQAADLLAFPDTATLQYIVGGHDCWANKGIMNKGSMPTIAEEFALHGIHLSRANIDRVQGANHVRSYLAHGENEAPRFRMFNTCPITYDCLTRMQCNPMKPEDVLKVDASDGDPMTGDDAYDRLRYGLMSRPPITERIVSRPTVGSDAWLKKEMQEMEAQALANITPNNDHSFKDDPWSKDPSMFDNR